MRILAIRGANLASLKAPFEIDLTAEPLASAGLFAITGETGAGKSTILDAMCLALYGDCPRLAQAGVNDEVPDAAGESIKSRDARAILRRGAASGFAEVDFLALDGVGLRARWGVRRSRGKAEGRLQNVERALLRLSDGQVLESQITAVNARVTEATGLSFDEFRRTVLLAQGDFDAFLVAGTGERAALLEKVTGTQLYRDISRRIYDRYGEAREALKALQDQRAGSMAMTDEEREALTETRAGLLAEIVTLNGVIGKLAADIDAHVRLAAGRHLAEQAVAAEIAARAASDAAAPDREKLRLIETALGLRAEHDRSVRARRARQEAETAYVEAQRRRDTLSAKEPDTEAAFEAATNGLDAAERTLKALEPEWTRASDLDGQIRAANKENAEAQTAQQEAAANVETKRKAHDALASERAAHAVTRDAAGSDIAARPGARRVAEQWDVISDFIDERRTLVERIGAQLKEVDSGRVAVEAARLCIEGLDVADKTDRQLIAAHEATAATARIRLRAIAEENPGVRMSHLLEGDAAVREMIRAAGEREAAENARAKAIADAAAAAEAEREALSAVTVAGDEAVRAKAAVDALVSPLDLAEAAASERAAHLRRHLVAGEPCPVCGATEHPISADAALAALARDLRTRIDTERAAEVAAATRASAAQTEIERARLAAAAAAAAQELAERQSGAAIAEFEAAQASAIVAALSTLAEDAACSVEALAALRVQLQGRRAEIAALQDEERNLSEEIETDAAQIAALRTAIDARASERSSAETIRSDSGRRAALAEQAASQARERVALIDRSLMPALAGIGQATEALDAEPGNVSMALREAATWFSDREQARANAVEAIAALDPAISAAAAARDAAAITTEIAAKTAQALRSRLGKLRLERATLLGGEDTETHRLRHNKARLAAQQARDAASAALSAVRSERAGLDAQLNALRDVLIAAQTELEAAEAALTAQLNLTGLDRGMLEALIAEGATTLEPLRLHLKAIDSALTSAAAEAKARQTDLQPLIAAGAPETPEAELRTARDAAEAARSERQQRAGALKGRLEADDHVRANLAALDGRIVEAKSVSDTWADVNEAIGSAQGDKFARIAQGVTLSMLVERANRHLAELKPRYQMARGGADLALHIVDRDMGDEVRSTRSLSGGERFLVSLALALALSGMGARGGLAATLFIDEGFGSLDAESLDAAIDALEMLQAQGRAIGVISHVEAMKDRIPAQIRVIRCGAGMSAVETGMRT